MSDDAVRRVLACLAHSDGPGDDSEERPPRSKQTFRETIERATAAIDDIETAAEFAEDDGLERLERAVEQAERSVSACTVDGQHALETFREFEEVAEGVRASEARAGSIGDHFHPGHGTSLGGGDIARSK